MFTQYLDEEGVLVKRDRSNPEPCGEGAIPLLLFAKAQRNLRTLQPGAQPTARLSF